MVEIRKNRREESLQKKRREGLQSQTMPASLHSPAAEKKAVWALGNVAGDSPRCRDLVLGHGALLPLLAQLNENAKLSMLRNATWTLSNFCRGKPQPSFDQVNIVIKSPMASSSPGFFRGCPFYSGNYLENQSPIKWFNCHLKPYKPTKTGTLNS
ncbi:hypothetical protein OIU77_015278 [Salix suchowensis]|uniref:IBB domain-containing protein n=1 Tax=Salix suchowensis TaxID=1278906 RepID=A0ABQ8ZS66_9ROSI|nr:hypothetical protein OIU77_015278 [Salix suchowensis]